MSAIHPEVYVLTIRRHWGDMQVTTDRRRHRRFDTTSVDARVALVETTAQGLQLGPCSLLNVSYSGMSVATDRRLDKHAEYRFLVDLGAPFWDVVLVRAAIRWVEPDSTGQYRVGAEFLESSKGWLGPDEEGSE